MQHPDEGTIHSWLDGALSPDEAAQVEAHVKDCPQCQAAVAEARGFIAASSRILTALDNAPRGVIPAAKPVKRIDPMVWRIAATVLVVAGGTLLVVRSNSVNEGSTFKTTAADTGGRVQAVVEKPEAAATKQLPQVVAGGEQKPQRDNVVTPRESRTDQRMEKSSPAAFGAIAGQSPAPLNANGTAQVGAAAPTAPPSPRAMAPLRASGLNAMADAAAEEPKLREIGPGRRAIGEKRTLYEVAPGDTVMLAEQMSMQLQSVVTTGASVTQTQGMAGAAQSDRSRATAKAAAPAEAPRPAAAPPMAAAPVMPSFIQGVDGTNTLIWNDSASGNVMKLSGHHTRAELESIRRRIEQVRAAAVRDSVKKD